MTLPRRGLHLSSQLGRIPLELGFDSDGLAAVRNHQDIDLFGRMVPQDMGGIDEHVVLVPSGMPGNEQFAQLAVQHGFRLGGRRSGHVPSCFIEECVSMATCSLTVSVSLVLVRSPNKPGDPPCLVAHIQDPTGPFSDFPATEPAILELSASCVGSRKPDLRLRIAGSRASCRKFFGGRVAGTGRDRL